jgi:membrane-bound serine protease (ClpP class)
MSLALKAHRAKTITGEEGLVGELGVARTPLQPEGKVFVHGELWDAVATASVGAGEQIQVAAVEGLRLKVKPAPEHSARSSDLPKRA